MTSLFTRRRSARRESRRTGKHADTCLARQPPSAPHSPPPPPTSPSPLRPPHPPPPPRPPPPPPLPRRRPRCHLALRAERLFPLWPAGATRGGLGAPAAAGGHGPGRLPARPAWLPPRAGDVASGWCCAAPVSGGSAISGYTVTPYV